MTSTSRIALLVCAISLLTGAASAQDSLVVGANVNMVSGDSFPNGDPFQRQQNEGSVAFSSRNNLHMLAGANDYRAVDVPGLPGGRETGDSWPSYFWSTTGGGIWKSNLIPGYPQDPACDGPNPPTLCGYAAGADPVVRAGVNGMFYYSGIVFGRFDPTRSAIFVSRFIDLNNDEGGDPIRYIDTVLLDTNDDGQVFLDKSWIGVDIPRGSNTRFFSVIQRDGSPVGQTVACGNLYVGYAAIEGEGSELLSEIRLATSTDCGDTWVIQPISQPDSLNQGANIAINPLTGELHVVWRRFDTVETFLGTPAAGCPASPSTWEINDDWPVSTITMGGVTYTIAEAQALLGTNHRGDESIKLAYEVIAAKLNLLTGGGDPVPGFDPRQWSLELTEFIAAADAWFVDNPVGSDPKQDVKKAGQNIKKDIQATLLGSGSCSGGGSGTPESTTGETNAILISSSNDAGLSFGSPQVIDESSTFDQGSTRFSFRTTAYATATVDAGGQIYVAWAARGFATIRGELSDGDARIVLSTSTDGVNWAPPYAIDEPNREGHQIKPSLLFAGQQLMMVYYDFRQDVSGIFEGFVVDLPQADRLRHTVDVRVATALPAAAPQFTDYSLISGTDDPVKPSGSASRYAFITSDFDDINGPGKVTLQAEYMVPGYPMFADGTTPFIGDYVDIAAPNLINEAGTWRFATDPGDVQVWQAVWSDNRNVIPPPDGDWSKYVAPILAAQPSIFDPTVTLPDCNNVVFTDALPQFQAGALYTGTRNQNVYSASITNGLVVAAPGNNRPLGLDGTGAPLTRGFVVFVQNATAETRTFQLTLPSILPIGVEASFAQNQPVTTQDVVIPPYSSAAATVFAARAASGAPTSEMIKVSVVETGGGGLSGSVLLNSDSAAPDPLTLAGGTSLLDAEVHNPAILNPAILNPAILNASVDPADLAICQSDPSICLLAPAILNPAILNPAILNPAILNLTVFDPGIFNPAILNPAILNPAILNPAILNPAILNPAILNPAVLNPAILNPAILNPAILNPAVLNLPAGSDSEQVDVTFTVGNDGNATTAYDLNLTAPQLPGLDYQLMVYRLNETPVAQGCVLTTEAQQQLILNQTDPLNNDIDGTFYLEPGQEVLVTFRVLPDTTAAIPGDPLTFNVADIGGQVTAQPTNSTAVADPPPSDEFGVPPTPTPTVLISDATPNPMAPGSGQLTNLTISGGPIPIFGTDTINARNDVTSTVSTNNFVFAGIPAFRIDGALRPALGNPDETGAVWIEYASGDISNEFPMTFRSTPVAPTIVRVSTAPAATGSTPTSCVDFSGTEIGPLDTVVGGDWVRIEAQGLDTNAARVNVLTTQASTAVSSTAGLCGTTAWGAIGFSYFVQIPAGVTSGPFTLQIRANQEFVLGGPAPGVFGGPGDYATIDINRAIDQEQPIFGVGGLGVGAPAANPNELAQGVTAGRTGPLVQVRLPVACSASLGINFVLEVQGVTATGLPDGVVLATTSVPSAQLPPFGSNPISFRTFSFASPASFNAGDQFALVFRAPPGGCSIVKGPEGPAPGVDSYTGGIGAFRQVPFSWNALGVFNPPFDFPFQTIVP